MKSWLTKGAVCLIINAHYRLPKCNGPCYWLFQTWSLLITCADQWAQCSKINWFITPDGFIQTIQKYRQGASVPQGKTTGRIQRSCFKVLTLPLPFSCTFKYSPRLVFKVFMFRSDHRASRNYRNLFQQPQHVWLPLATYHQSFQRLSVSSHGASHPETIGIGLLDMESQGTPQGSVLSPFIFNVAMIKLPPSTPTGYPSNPT